MIPSSFILLDRLPLTPNGKVDRASIAEQYRLAPPNSIADADIPNPQPQTAIEQQLIEIWQQVLGISNVSVQDNFFAIGGDSILAIQVIAKARQAGMNFFPKQMFQAQTIAELAQLAQSASIPAAQGIITGTVPLTPIQHWFFQQSLSEMHHWNQAVLLEVGKIKPKLLDQAWQILLAHHDALRLRFHPTETGWQQTHALPEAMAPLIVFDLTSQPPNQQSPALETTAANLQTCLDLSTNPLKIALFQCDKSDRLLIIIHHLLIDGVSWRILLNDLQNLYHQLQQGQPPQLPPKTTSFQQWSTALSAYAHSPELLKTLDYWRDRPSPSLPIDRPGSNTMAEVQTLGVSLTIAETQALLQTVPTRYQTQINDVLLTALIQTFAAWTGNSTLLIELEGHGREDLLEAIDLSHTVGWFTSLFPVWLNLESSQDLGIALKSIKEQLRQIPQRGFSYGVLRYLAEESVQAQMRSLPRPEVRFNYLGQIDQALSPPFAIAPELAGATRSPLANRDVLLEINGMIAAGQLRFTWSYSRAIHHSSTIQTLADQFIHHLSQLIQHCQSPQSGGYTPSDFPLMSISQAELDDLLTDL
ncbi:MAG: hypothetical protein HC781_08930 [Leptolyngbyaceae cyanobacterium CSU_1_4]|nr:hypothetical protein [Leptolyngbyaceae cyanobacterium CSU_1_4]